MKIFEKEKIDDLTRNYYIFGIKIYTRIKKSIKINNKKLTKNRKKESLLFIKCLNNLNDKINTAKTLILGHSHARFGFIENENSINFGIDGEDLYYSYMILEKYKNLIPNLKNIVLFYSLFSPGSDLQKSPNQSIRTAYYDVFLDIPYKNKYLAYKNDVIIFAKKLKKLGSYIKQNVDKIPKDIMTQDEKIYVPEALEKKYIKSWIKLNKKNTEIHFVKNILDICEEKGFKLTIFLSPYNPRIKALLPNSEICYKSLYDITKNYSCVQIINKYNNNEFTEDDFLDMEHVNKSGAKKITHIINKNLD